VRNELLDSAAPGNAAWQEAFIKRFGEPQNGPIRNSSGVEITDAAVEAPKTEAK